MFPTTVPEKYLCCSEIETKNTHKEHSDFRTHVCPSQKDKQNKERQRAHFRKVCVPKCNAILHFSLTQESYKMSIR
jgi:hypothetical protein